MKKISTLYEFERFIGLIIEEGVNFLAPLKDMEDKFDILKVYDKTVDLACNYFTMEVTLTSIPFFMKVDLVNFVINTIHGESGIINMLKNLYSTPFYSNSQLLTEIKNDYKACTTLANLSCLVDNYEWSYFLVNHVYENMNNISKTHYLPIIHDLAFLLESLSTIIQKLLYNDVGRIMNNDVVKFTFAFMQSNDAKKQDTVVFKRLSVEYPEILKVYQQAVNVLKAVQTRKSILM